MIVAVNKMDKKEFNLERVKEQLTAHDVVPEDWGGSTIVVPISALTGQNVEKLSSDELADIRNQTIGFVFQGFNLLSRTSAVENVELPMVYSGIEKTERRQKAEKALIDVGLKERMYHQPNQLSGGQQQRVAIARAIVNEAPIIFADEPTGNLDTKMSVEIMHLFQQLNRDLKRTIILVTHEEDIARFADRIIHIVDGEISVDEKVKH